MGRYSVQLSPQLADFADVRSGRGARGLVPDVKEDSGRAGAGEGPPAGLFVLAGLREVEVTALEAGMNHATFDEWWDPFPRGVGPAGAYTSKLDVDRRARLIE